MNFLKEKPLVAVISAFLIGLVVMGAVWSFSTNKSANPSMGMPTSAVSTMTPEERMAQQKELMETRLAEAKKIQAGAATTTGKLSDPAIYRPMPWRSAVNFIKSSNVESIKVSGLDLVITMQGGSVFYTTQPTADAYVDAVEASKSEIKIIK